MSENSNTAARKRNHAVSRRALPAPAQASSPRATSPDKPDPLSLPDICILAEHAPRQKVIDVAPELCIEILSPQDTLTRTMELIRDYFNMGVPLCWIVDPVSQTGWVATSGHLEEATDRILRAPGIEMPLAEVLE